MTEQRSVDLAKIDRAHVLHPLCPVGDNKGIVFEAAEGVWLRDTARQSYIDGSSQLANVNLGHGRLDIVEAAMAQGRNLQYASLYYGYSNTAIIECSQSLAQLTPEGLDHFFFGSGGTDAVECALKLSRVFWHNQGLNKHKIISLYNSYHGSSYGAVSATALSSNFWKGAYPLVGGFIHAPSYLEHRTSGYDLADRIETIIQSEGPESVAAVIAEPVQGAGGVVTPPPDFWPALRQICTKHDVLLIADEVMTGFGRTGRMFALEHWRVVPDIMTVAKGLTGGYFPFGATVLSTRVFDGLRDTYFAHGLTYSGHPMCAAAAVKAMKIYEEEDILGHVVRISDHANERLESEFGPLSCVGEAGGLGLFLTLEVLADEQTAHPASSETMTHLQAQMLDAGLWIRFSHNRFHICPPLTTTLDEMDQLLDIMKSTLVDLEGRMSS